MMINELFVKFTQKHGLPMVKVPAPEGIPDYLGIMIQGEFGDWESYGMCFEEENLFVFFINYGVQVPVENRDTVSAVLNEINYQLKVGGIYMDTESGNLMTRTAQYIYGTEQEREKLVEETIKVSAVITDAYYKRVMGAAFESAEED